MKIFISGLFMIASVISASGLFGSTVSAEELPFYVGTTSQATGNDIPVSEGIYRYTLNTQTGALTACGLAAKAKSPSFVVSHPNRDLGCYYTVAGNEDGQSRESLVIAFKKQADGGLDRINTLNSGGFGACHLAVHPSGKFLYVANYSSGQVSFFSLRDDGGLDKLLNVDTHEGRGPNNARQRAPYAHWVGTSPNGKFVYCCDLGVDRVYIYKYNDAANKWLANPTQAYATVSSGAGCRHAIFTPNGMYFFVLNELIGTLDTFLADPDTGTLTAVQTCMSIPADFYGDNKAAAIDIHPSGKFLYVSNRGPNLVTAFAVSDKEIRSDRQMAGSVLSTLQYAQTGGDFPRFIGLDPSGKFLLACNKKVGTIVVFTVDQQTGKLTNTGHSTQIGWPVSIAF